jgi:formate/nitrite transporter
MIFDALLPPEMAKRALEVGENKARLNAGSMFVLSLLAGAFIALGAIFFTVTVTGGGIPYGPGRLLGGLSFCLGLILVVVAGAELFTGNNLIIMALVSGKISVFDLLRNWLIVYVGNFVGAVLTAMMMYYTAQYTGPSGGGAIGITALTVANGKCALSWSVALTRGIYCNALVCLAVWLCYAARSTTDRILSIVFPISAFVACGFEHCVANMYFIPIGLLIKNDALFMGQVAAQVGALDQLTIFHFLLNNLIPVTLGNIIGGSGLVGLIYWWIFLRPQQPLPGDS